MSRASGMTSANVGPIAEAREVRLERHAGAAHRVAPLAADRDDREVARVLGDLAGREPDRVGVQRAGEAAVGRDQHDEPLAALALGEQRVILAAEDGGEVGEDLVDLLAVGPRRERRVLGALQLRRRNELHRPRDLLDVPDGADPAPDISLGCHGRQRPPCSPHGGVVGCARSLTCLGLRSLTCSPPPCPGPPVQRTIPSFRTTRPVTPGRTCGSRRPRRRAPSPARRSGSSSRRAP